MRDVGARDFRIAMFRQLRFNVDPQFLRNLREQVNELPASGEGALQAARCGLRAR